MTTRRFAPVVGLAILAGGAAGCALDEGRGFARLSGTLTARFAGATDAGRLSADGWFRTDRSFELLFQSMELDVGDLVLLSSGTGPTSAACTFDPANPPAGCTSCHGGHCHCGSELRSYEELEAEVCGAAGTGSPTAVGGLHFGTVFDLLQPTRQIPNGCIGSCELGLGRIDQIAVTLSQARTRATMRDLSLADRLGGALVPVQIELALGGLRVPVTLPEPVVIDPDQPYRIHIDADLSASPELFDGVEWDLLVSDGAVVITETSLPEVAQSLHERLAQAALTVTTTRDEE